MVPEGATPLDPVGTAPGLVVPAGGAGRRRPARARRASCSRCGRRRWRPTPVREVLGAGDAAARLHAAHVRHPGVRDRQEPARDRGRGRRRSPRSRSRPACGAARSRSTSATATRRRRPPRRCARASPSATRASSSARTARRSTPRSRELLAGPPARPRPSRAAAACWRRGSPTCPGASAYFAGSVVAYSNEAKAELLGVDPALIERHGAVSPRGRRGDGARARSSASAPTSRSRSPGSPARTAAARRSRSATSASTPASPTAPAIAREPVIPGGRADIRERSALVGMHLLRILLERRRAASVAESARDSLQTRVVPCARPP